MIPFSVVIPVHNDLDLIRQNLPSWCTLNPDEIILCFDNPAPKDNVLMAKAICSTYQIPLKILEISENPEWRFHQAMCRRIGFREAKHNIILTGDIDLNITENCLKALNHITGENVGLVSLSKRRCRQGFVGACRNVFERFYQNYAKILGQSTSGKVAYFTGLYFFKKQAWLDSEPIESIKQLENPKYASFIHTAWGGFIGEDTHLRDHMIKKYRCLYLPDIGALDTRLGLEDTPMIQYKIGLKFAFEKRSFLRIMLHAILHLRPYVLIGYLSRGKIIIK